MSVEQVDLAVQSPIVAEFCPAFGMPMLEVPKFEVLDVVAGWHSPQKCWTDHESRQQGSQSLAVVASSHCLGG